MSREHHAAPPPAPADAGPGDGGSARPRPGPIMALVSVVIVAACMVSATLLFAGRGTATAAPTGRDCTVLGNLSEATIHYYYVGGGDGIPVHGVGSSLIYYDDIYNAQGAVIGHTVGFVSATYQRPSDGHLITQYYESVQLADGMFSDSGTVDRFAMFSGDPVNLAIVGTAGAYTGMTGTRQWWFPQPIQNPPPQTTRLKVRLTLCR